MRPFDAPKSSLGDLDADTVARVATAASDLTLVLDAADLARFRLLTGLDLSGAANLLVSARGEAMNRSFAVDLSGRTTDLRLGVETADALLAGEGTVALRAVRDEAGFRIEDATVATIALTGSGALQGGV